MVSEIIANFAFINKDNLDPNQYTVSLLHEGFRAGLVDKEVIDGIQQQIMLILKDLIIRYTKGESASVKVETAENILNSIYYSIDAYLCSFNHPEEGITLLKTINIHKIYEKGLALVSSCLAETKALFEEIRKDKLDLPLEVYNSAIDEDLPEFFRDYGVVFGAHETMCSADYPLVFDDMSIKGILYIRQYLEKLAIETEFCRLFSKEDTVGILANYGRIYQTDYMKSPLNLFEILVNNSIFAVLLGKNAEILSISTFQSETLQRQLDNLHASEINSLIHEAIEKMMNDLSITRPELIAYIHQYEAVFAQRIINAVENKSLHNMILTDAEENLQGGRIIFEEGTKVNDDSFRSVVHRITVCANITEKITIIKTSIHSLVDLIDLFNADCLFGDEFAEVFGTLSDMELAVLGKTVFFEELRNGPLNLSSTTIDKSETEVAWQVYYIGFMQSLSADRIKEIERFVNVIEAK